MIAKDQLKATIERVERLEEEKKAIADDIRDVYSEAKAHGFDVKALRAIVRLRSKQSADERKEQEAILETYMFALGMIVGEGGPDRNENPSGGSGNKSGAGGPRQPSESRIIDIADRLQGKEPAAKTRSGAPEQPISSSDSDHVGHAETSAVGVPTGAGDPAGPNAAEPRGTAPISSGGDGLDLPPFLRRCPDNSMPPAQPP